MASTEPTPKIQTRGLVRKYGKRQVVNGVDLEISGGEIVGLLGPNGAGKTTTFYMIVGLIAPTEGVVLLDDDDLSNLPMYRRARRGIGYLPQEPSVFRKVTVEQNIRAVAETLPLSRTECNACVEEHLEELGLTHLAKQKAFTLSGGERRRLEISRALVTTPKFLLMDEPFSALDAGLREHLQIEIRKLQKALGITTIFVTHDQREAMAVADRIVVLNNGRI